MRPMYRLAFCFAVLLACLVAASAKEVYVFDAKWGSHGTADGQFKGNIGISIRGNRVYTTENDGYRVQIFDLDGNFVGKFGSFGTGSGYFYAPRQAVVDSLLHFYVVDSENDRVAVFGSNYLPLSSFGSDGSGNQNFKNPWRLALNDTTHMLYVADYSNDRVCQWTTAGTFVRTFGTHGTGNGQFVIPSGVAVDSTGTVYVTDSGNHRVQKFTGDGVYLAKWNVGPSTSAMSMGAIAAGGGYIFVEDGAYGVIRKYTSSGTELCQFGSTGTGNGQFDSIDGVAVDDSGRVFVSDGQLPTSRIQRFVRDVLPTAPTVVRVLPKLPDDSDSLTAQVSGSTDADGDPLTYRYQWYASNNNSTWSTMLARARVLPASGTAPSYYYKVAARAYDGKAFGPWKFSTSVHILAGSPSLALTALSATTGGGALAVTVTLSEAATVGGTLCNLAGMPVATVSGQSLAAGTSNLLLPALSNRGLKLPAGQYLLKLRASTDAGQCANCIVPVLR